MLEEVAQVKPLRDVIKEHVLTTLGMHNGHVVRTAEALHLSPKTVYTMLHRWGVKLARGRPKGATDKQEDVTAFLTTTGLKKPSLKRARIKSRNTKED